MRLQHTFAGTALPQECIAKTLIIPVTLMPSCFGGIALLLAALGWHESNHKVS